MRIGEVSLCSIPPSPDLRSSTLKLTTHVSYPMLKVFLLGSLLFGSSYAAQIPRSSTYQTRHQARDQQDTSNQYITSQISALAEESLKSSGTPGLSLGVVQLDPNTKALKTEFGAWGTWTEDGDKTTQDVGLEWSLYTTF